MSERRQRPPWLLAARIVATYFVVPSAAATVALWIVFQFFLKPSYGVSGDQLDWVADAARVIEQRYFEEVDKEQLTFDAIRGMAENLDPYSDFIDPRSYAAFREDNEGQYVGIGFVVYAAGPPVTVLYTFPGSPAQKAGLDVGDRIVAIDGEDCTQKENDEVIARIKSLPGTPVRLRIRAYAPDGKGPERETTIVRELIERPSVFDARIVDAATGAAYVRVSAFQEHTIDELKAALDSLSRSGMKSLVLDLRRNRGGLLDQAVAVASLFLKDAVVVRTEGRTADANQVYRTAPQGREDSALPLALLVDGITASASEVVAGAMQDHLRAPLVGERTFGKGMVQTMMPREYEVDGARQVAVLKLTTSRYLTPAGRALESRVGLKQQRRGGLIPDLTLRLDDRERRALEQNLADREIPLATWQRIRERCPRVEAPQGGWDLRVADRQLEKAVELLNGAPLYQPLY